MLRWTGIELASDPTSTSIGSAAVEMTCGEGGAEDMLELPDMMESNRMLRFNLPNCDWIPDGVLAGLMVFFSRLLRT